ncbi:hypothetical protein B0J14DRAFT_600250 [Halenospora varia]|nr:hypothetical protein B0J14DRAFT_600250 [Halenospora varia]
MAYVPRGKIVTTYVGPEGKSHFGPISGIEVQPLFDGATVRRITKLPKVPVPNIPWSSDDEHKDLANAGGVTFIEGEMEAHTQTPMHATPSVDLGTIVTGEVVLVLDSGEEMTLKAGDLYIQNATNHAWHNRSDQPVRFTTSLIASTADS